MRLRVHARAIHRPDLGLCRVSEKGCGCPPVFGLTFPLQSVRMIMATEDDSTVWAREGTGYQQGICLSPLFCCTIMDVLPKVESGRSQWKTKATTLRKLLDRPLQLQMPPKAAWCRRVLVWPVIRDCLTFPCCVLRVCYFGRKRLRNDQLSSFDLSDFLSFRFRKD